VKGSVLSKIDHTKAYKMKWSLLLVLLNSVASSAFVSPPISHLFNFNTNPQSRRKASSFASSAQQYDELVDCLVVGGGLSGSSLAFNLAHEHGLNKIMLGKRKRVDDSIRCNSETRTNRFCQRGTEMMGL
jgi:hypothetical protein